MYVWEVSTVLRVVAVLQQVTLEYSFQASVRPQADRIQWGVFQTLTTTYASEGGMSSDFHLLVKPPVLIYPCHALVCPVVLRAYLTTWVNFCWGLGQLIASGALRGFLSRSDQWAYRIPYALQWMWPVPLIIGISFAPDSPWWLVRRSRYQEAREALQRLTSAASEEELDQTIAMMRHTDDMEREVSAGTSYSDCFKGVDLRRTEITCLTWACQPLCGASLVGFSV